MEFPAEFPLPPTRVVLVVVFVVVVVVVVAVVVVVVDFVDVVGIGVFGRLVEIGVGTRLGVMFVVDSRWPCFRRPRYKNASRTSSKWHV